MTAGLRARGLECRRGRRTVVAGVDLDVAPGERLALVGPNGAGKSTLLRVLAGMDTPAAGSVRVVAGGGSGDEGAGDDAPGDDEAGREGGPAASGSAPPDLPELHGLSSRRRARLVAVMGQEETPSGDLTLREAVALGRTPHRSPWSLGADGDRDVIDDALARVGLAGRGEQSCARLSGGERHRVVLARTLAQDTPLLLLDEPTNHLDAAWRLRLMTLLDRLDRTVVAAMHDLDLVLRHFDRVAVVDDGTVTALGPPVEVLTPELLRRVFGVVGELVRHPRTGEPHLLLSDAAATTDPVIPTSERTHP